MAVKVQQTKLLEFWGQKEKDSISANEFVKRVDKMMSANNWTDKVAFDNFGLALKGETNTWLDSQVLLKKIVGDRERWSIIRPFFKEEFATESNDKLILDGLTHMAMRPTENVRSFFGRLNKVNTVILDAYHSYMLTPPDPAVDATGNHVITPADFQAYKKTLVENLVEFYILNQFQAHSSWISGGSSTSNQCTPWIWTQQSDLLSLSSALRTRLRDLRKFRPFNKRTRKNLLKPSLTIGRGVSAPIRIEANNRQIVSNQNKAFVL
jgi:hypothetical protein